MKPGPVTQREIDRPFGVWAEGIEGVSGFLAGYHTLEQAEARCKQANENAIVLGINIRYVVRSKTPA